MACYVFNKKIYTDKNKIIDLVDDNSKVYKFNNYFEATYFLSQDCHDKYKNKLISIKSLVKRIAMKLDIDFNKYTKISKDRIGKDNVYKLDTFNINKLGWKPKISINDGLERVIKWYQSYSGEFIRTDYEYKHKK